MLKPSRTILRRGTVFLIAACVLWVILMIRLFVLQIVKYDYYHKLVVDNVTSTTTISANRGIIYDCNMTELAYDMAVERIFISPAEIENDEQKQVLAENLSRLLNVEYDFVMEKANKDKTRKDETIKNRVEKEEADTVRAFVNEYNEKIKMENEAHEEDEQKPLLSCVHFAETAKRYYPFGSLAAQTIGFTGTDGQGLFGLELEYNSYLQGVSGKIITAVNARGSSLPTKYESYVDAESGYNIVTTIDHKVQSILESYLEESFYDNKAGNRVCGLVMDVNTGGILAMATYPNFDLNDPYVLDGWSTEQLNAYVEGTEEYSEAEAQLRMELWNNKCISSLYEPGSTFKIITTSMAIEEKRINPYVDTVVCPETYYVDPNDHTQNPVNCHKLGGHGQLTYAEGLQQSCNPCLMEMAKRLGRNVFYKYFQAFGYTERTGIDLPGEYRSIYSPYSDFYLYELCIYSFGQTFKVTPLQQLTGICTVANGGTLVTPHIVSKLIDDDGNIIKSFEPEAKRRVVSEETCETVTRILQEGVSGNGAAKNAYVKGYKIAAKTGTSQKQDKYDENGERPYRVGSCVSYAPSDNPQFAVLIICDEPNGDSVFGSMTAAPYVSRTTGDILSYMNIDPVYTEAELASLAYTAPDFSGMTVEEARAKIEADGLEAKVFGSGEIVTSQMPEKGTQFQKDRGFVVLYASGEGEQRMVTVPDIAVDRWMDEENAKYVCAINGLNLYIYGIGNNGTDDISYSYRQSLEPGTQVPYGTPITVYFRYYMESDG